MDKMVMGDDLAEGIDEGFKTAAETASRMALIMGRHLDSMTAWKQDSKTASKKQAALSSEPLIMPSSKPKQPQIF
jgi:hypothetical protein